MRKMIAALMVITCGINTAWAVRIHGTVKLADENEAIPGVIIQPYNSKNEVLPGGTDTDANGNFDFSVPDNTDHVVIHLIGRKDQTFKPSELTGQTILLQTDAFALGEVVVTGTRTTTTGDGCDNEANDRITPELALCSVHAYNIGISTNPSGADKQLMKEIVALKTTVITQQMNKQYEYLDSMIRRFKTQLEKAVLTTKLQAAGGAPASGDGGASADGAGTYGGGKSGAVTQRVGITNAEDCISTGTSSAATFQCLLRNVAKIQSAAASGDIASARRQLTTDRTALMAYNKMALSCDTAQANCTVNTPCENALVDGKNCDRAIQSASTRTDITTCLGQFRACIIANTEAGRSK